MSVIREYFSNNFTSVFYVYKVDSTKYLILLLNYLKIYYKQHFMNINTLVMKPKISSGYLTPQANRQKKVMDNLSGNKKKNGKVSEIDDEVFKTLMQCPEKKKMILKLLALNKDAIEEYQQKEGKVSEKIKKKKINCESPTALFRRKALEQMNSPRSLSQDSLKELAVESSNPVAHNKVFEGITVFVEIISNGEDRSEGVKSVLKSMGAKVKDRITSDVTHVVFKGGSFTTFNKAKIIKAHIVSVLWVEASRRALQKQDERLYHAIKSTPYNHDTTLICKKMEREYEDIIKKEYKRSTLEGSPLPSTDTLINRRRTFMASASSCLERNDSFDTVSPERNNPIDNYGHFKTPVCLNSSDMELTMIDCVKPSENHLSKNVNNSNKIDTVLQGDIRNSHKRRALDKRKTICSISTDTDKTPSDISAHTASLELHPPKNSTDDSIIFGKNSVIAKKLSANKDLSDKISKKQVSTEEVMSQLMISSDMSDKGQKKVSTQSSRRKSSVLRGRKSYQPRMDIESTSVLSDIEVSSKGGRKKSIMSLRNSTDTESSGKISALQVSAEGTKSSMSSLRVSSEHPLDKKEISLSTESAMSPLAIRSINLSSNDKHCSFTSSERNNSGFAEFVDNVVVSLMSNEEITTEGDSKSDGSEIISPRKCCRNLFTITGKSQKENQNQPSSSSSESGIKPVRRKRKLYDPDDPVLLKVNDEEEREQRREAVIMKLNKSKEKLSDTNAKNTSTEEDVSPSTKNLLSNSANKKTPTRQESEEGTSSSDENCRVLKTKKARKPKKKIKAKVDFDSSSDEQRDLLQDIIGAKTPAINESPHKSQVIRPPDSVTPYRRSTMDFLPPSQINSTKRVRRTDIVRMPTIVCTKLHSHEVKLFTDAVQALGRFRVENAVSSSTTHLVAGESKRTVNMLKAISRGCWVVNFDWVLKSVEKGKWLPEEDFEVMDFAPIVQKSRLQRQAFGSKYSMDIFENCGPIFIGFDTNPKSSDLKELVVLCKGKLVNTKRRARIVIGELCSEEDVVCLNEIWVLDCIKKNRLLSFKNIYLLDKDGNKRESIVV
ncbi:microcephalin isoform X1 [Rhynchophorus ferrugineus]|uniref:microcephalin isoform X1 n=2 Tax=Rhynchophorus ferrugineus TaxID=354439 RepID=UPI003FCD1F97